MATAAHLLDIARAELGTKESPDGSNKVKYSTWYGLTGPWCVMFVMWCCNQAGVDLPIRTASCSALRAAAQSAGMWVTGGYQSGDIVIYDWGRDGVPDHCGIIETAGGSSVVSIEGNTAVGNDSNGGEVMRRTRTLSQIIGAVRPTFDTETEDDDVTRYTYLTDIPAKFQPIIKTLMDADIIQGDGSDPTGNGDVIDLSHDQVRMLVFAYRGGAFDAKLKAAGLTPAVE